MFGRAKTFLLLLMAALCCLSCGVQNDGEDDVDESSAIYRQWVDEDWVSVEAGPWGVLEYRRFFLPLPKVWRDTPARNEPIVWHVPQITPARLDEMIATGPLTEVEKRLWKETCRTEAEDDGTAIHPSKEFRWMLCPESRRLLYIWLGRFPRNEAQVFPFSYAAEGSADWFVQCNLRPELMQAMEHFFYSSGNAVCFADLDLLDEYLDGPDERAELLAVLHRQPCCELRVRINSNHTNLNNLSTYWGEWQRVAKVHAKFQKALQNQHSPALVSVSNLIPPLPRSWLNTYPSVPTDLKQPLPDCYWTALNFFNTKPDAHYYDAAFIENAFRNEHDHIVDEKPRYGDILLLTDRKGHPIHAAVYLAADFVYTKNGFHPTKPWVMMKLSDMKAAYPLQGPLHEEYYRWNPQKDSNSPSLTSVATR